MTAGIHMHVLYMYLIKKQYKQSGFDAQDCSPRTQNTANGRQIAHYKNN